MPAYIRHCEECEIASVMCPGCTGLLPMYVRDVQPHWSLAKIDFIYECAECGAEVRQTVEKPLTPSMGHGLRPDWVVELPRPSMRRAAGASG